MDHLASSPELTRARHAFFEKGSASSGLIPENILQSWRRCRSLGLPAERSPRIEPVPAARLKEMRERNERLWRLARAELEVLAADAAATGSIVVLTDNQGWILDAEGSPKFLDRAGRVALMPGACWNESRTGTNAIGTAIVEGRSVEVRGGEHYLAPHGILTCSAAPIYDPFGQLVGVLDISGDASDQHMHALGLAKLAVANIEHRYFEDGIVDGELLRLHSDPGALRSSREGLLAFRKGRLVAANHAGLQLFGLNREALGKTRFDSLFEDSISRLRDDGVLLDRQGRALFGRVHDAEADRPRRPSTRAPITVSGVIAAGQAEAMLFDQDQEMELKRACRVLDAGLPVLVTGDTGTGKEVFARELHRRCSRAGMPFVAVNCAALPEGLIEAELFGYEGGAFTGARRNGSPGLIRQADGGVLFLDEIGDMPLALQPRLLRVLQERELSPLGGGKPVKLDFALVCATHQDLEAAIGQQRFRADLYYRLAHHCIRIAALRDHADRAEVVRTLWSRMAHGRRLGEQAIAALAAYAWPGNLRQLSACLRTLVALSDAGALVDVDSLPTYLRDAPARSVAAYETSAATAGTVRLDTLAESAMREALQACNGNVAQAARRLGVSRSTLYRRLGSDPRAGA